MFSLALKFLFAPVLICLVNTRSAKWKSSLISFQNIPARNSIICLWIWSWKRTKVLKSTLIPNSFKRSEHARLIFKRKTFPLQGGFLVLIFFVSIFGAKIKIFTECVKPVNPKNILFFVESCDCIFSDLPTLSGLWV